MKSSDTARGAVLALAALAVSTLPFASPAAAESAVLLKGLSVDGAAFDLDEYLDGDIVVQAQEAGQDVDVDDASDLQYVWSVTPYDGSPATSTPAAFVTDETATPGEFAVPFPTDRISGTYALRARLTGARAFRTVLRVDAGEAALVLDGDEPLRLDAGQENDVTGSLLLEDGTPLPGRGVDLRYTPGSAGGDATPDAAFAQPIVQTAADGAFTGVLADEPGEGTELGGTVTATSSDADAADDLDVDLVSRTLAEGSTITATPLGAGTPGEALPATVTVEAPDGEPIEGQVVELSLDHGFFTSVPRAVAGEQVGDLTDAGDTMTALTDENGEIDVLVGIGRDTDFDDDGEVEATMTAASDGVTGTSVAEWSTADSLNGQVVIEPSPAAEQDGPVGPTVSGQRTYLEVHAQDQFGNRIAGQPIDLAYGGNRDDFDYSEDFKVSDFDTDGDIWVASFEAGDSSVTGSWDGAPVTTYAVGGTVDSGTDTATGTLEVSYYDLDFGASTFSLTSSPRRFATVGSAVTQTVRVIDQEGNPVQGYDVQFFRFGPDRGRGDVRRTVATNSRGEARYTFVGNRVGTGRITAEVTDGVRTRTLTSTVEFRGGSTLRLVAGKAGSGADELRLVGSEGTAGARVVLFRQVGDRLRQVRAGRLDDAGRLAVTVADRNGRQPTTYVAKLRSTGTTAPATSKPVTLR